MISNKKIDGVKLYEGEGYACFFCFERKATSALQLNGKSFPTPIPQGATLAMCDECCDMPAKEKARIILSYAKSLQEIESN